MPNYKPLLTASTTVLGGVKVDGSTVTIASGVISAASGGLSFINVSGTTQTAAINTGYIANNAGLVTITLPSTAAIGSIVEVAGAGAGGWKLAQGSGQSIKFGVVTSTSGATGSISSTVSSDSIRVICTVANSGWAVISSVGNLSVA